MKLFGNWIKVQMENNLNHSLVGLVLENIIVLWESIKKTLEKKIYLNAKNELNELFSINKFIYPMLDWYDLINMDNTNKFIFCSSAEDALFKIASYSFDNT